MFSWWQSLEVINKLASIATILLICFSVLSLVFKLQSDHLKRQLEQAQRAKIEALNVKIEDLKIKAKKAARGISSTYDFHGVKRDIKPGEIKATSGEETVVFKEMVDLQKEKKYPELLSLCKKQISKTPEWLTPYLFMGVAQANMGLTDDAILNFNYVIDNAADDPDYQQAKEFKKKLQNR